MMDDSFSVVVLALSASPPHALPHTVLPLPPTLPLPLAAGCCMPHRPLDPATSVIPMPDSCTAVERGDVPFAVSCRPAPLRLDATCAKPPPLSPPSAGALLAAAPLRWQLLAVTPLPGGLLDKVTVGRLASSRGDAEGLGACWLSA